MRARGLVHPRTSVGGGARRRQVLAPARTQDTVGILRLLQVFFEKSEEKYSLRFNGVVCGYLLRS